MEFALGVGQRFGKLAGGKNAGTNLSVEVSQRKQFAARSGARVQNANDLSDLVLDVFDREYQIGVVRDDHGDVAVAAIGVDQ